MKEIELLFKIDKEKAEEIRQKLKEFFTERVIEIDTYFYPPHKDFLVSEEGRENLRVRKSKNKNELTYKRVIYNKGQYSHSIEKSVEISDPEKIIEILKLLGFRIHFIVSKKRETFKEKKFKITIDDVKNLGIFVEIEWIGPKKSNKEIKKECIKKASELGLEKIQDKGYLRLLEEKLKI